MDLSALNLTPKVESVPIEEAPKITLAREKVLEEANRALEAQQTSDLKLVSLVVIGRFPLMCSKLLTTRTAKGMLTRESRLSWVGYCMKLVG